MAGRAPVQPRPAVGAMRRAAEAAALAGACALLSGIVGANAYFLICVIGGP